MQTLHKESYICAIFVPVPTTLCVPGLNILELSCMCLCVFVEILFIMNYG